MKGRFPDPGSADASDSAHIVPRSTRLYLWLVDRRKASGSRHRLSFFERTMLRARPAFHQQSTGAVQKNPRRGKVSQWRLAARRAITRGSRITETCPSEKSRSPEGGGRVGHRVKNAKKAALPGRYGGLHEPKPLSRLSPAPAANLRWD